MYITKKNLACLKFNRFEIDTKNTVKSFYKINLTKEK